MSLKWETFSKEQKKNFIFTLTLVNGYGCYMASKYIEHIYDVMIQIGCAIKVWIPVQS